MLQNFNRFSTVFYPIRLLDRVWKALPIPSGQTFTLDCVSPTEAFGKVKFFPVSIVIFNSRHTAENIKICSNQ